MGGYNLLGRRVLTGISSLSLSSHMTNVEQMSRNSEIVPHF